MGGGGGGVGGVGVGWGGWGGGKLGVCVCSSVFSFAGRLLGVDFLGAWP